MNRFYLDEDRVIEADMSSDASLHTDEMHKVHGKMGLRDLGFYFSLYCQEINKELKKQLNHIVRDFYAHTEIFLDDPKTAYTEGTKFIQLLRSWRPKVDTFEHKYHELKNSLPTLTEKRKSRFEQTRKIKFIDMLDKIINLYSMPHESSTNAFDSSKIIIQMQINKIQQLYDQSRFQEGISAGLQACNTIKSPEIYFILGNCYKALQYFDQSIHYYTKAIKLFQLGHYYNNRGNSYLAIQQINKAEHDYLRAIELQPMNEVYLGNYGNVCLNLKKYEKSIQLYNRAINIDPNNDVFFNNQAFAQIKLKQYDEAIESYNRALKICPTHHIYLKNRANLYMEKKKVKEALHDINKAIQIEPKHEYYFLKGKWQYLSGAAHAAMMSFSKAMQLEPHKQSYHEYYGAIRQELGLK